MSQSKLHEMAISEHRLSRLNAVRMLGSHPFLLVNDAKVWQDLHNLIWDNDYWVRLSAIHALKKSFQYITDKNKAYDEWRKLIEDKNFEFRGLTAKSIGSIFPMIPDKDLAWADLVRLSEDEDEYVRESVSIGIGLAFPYIPNKKQAIDKLYCLSKEGYAYLDDKNSVASLAIWALGQAIPHVPYQDQRSIWNFLCERLNGLSYEREAAIEAISSNIPQIIVEDQCLKQLNKLTSDEDSYIRSVAYFCLARTLISKASEAKNDDDFKVYIENAIGFFESASKEDAISPAAFCLPFYKSLYGLIFSNLSHEEEIYKYISEARAAAKKSERKEILLEAVENLSKALQEVRSYTIDDINKRKRDLRSYTRYCIQVSNCMKRVRANAPLASKIIDYALIEKSIPIIDQKIKALFRDVEAAAGMLCKSTKGTDLEAFGRDAYESTRGLNKVELPQVADRYLEEIVPLLEGHCNRLPRESQAYLKTLVNFQNTASLEQRLDTLKSVLLASLVQGENDDRLVKELKELLDLHLKNIEFAILNLNTSSGNARKDLYNLKTQIDGLQKEIESQGLAKKELAEALDEKDQAMIDRLEKMREKMLKTVRETTQLNASKRDVETILKELEGQDKLKKRDVLGIIADLSSLAGMALSILL